jgi:hypothetical protein
MGAAVALGYAGLACASEGDRTVLETFTAGAQTPRVYELSVARCSEGKCPIEIRLLEKQTPLAVSTLDWSAPASMATQAPAGSNSGVGDPLEAGNRPKIWVWGEDEGTVTTAARSVALSLGRTGLLIDQMAGFEHPKRRHYLYVEEGDKLLRAWTAAEPQGPHWTTVELRPASKSGSQDILLFEGFQPGGDEPDSLKATCLAWAGKSSQLVASAGCTGLYAITVGVWPAVDSARQAQAAAGECLSQYWVVRPARSVGAQRYVLRAVTAHKALAEQALRAARRCAPQLTRSLSSYQP